MKVIPCAGLIGQINWSATVGHPSSVVVDDKVGSSECLRTRGRKQDTRREKNRTMYPLRRILDDVYQHRFQSTKRSRKLVPCVLNFESTSMFIGVSKSTGFQYILLISHRSELRLSRKVGSNLWSRITVVSISNMQFSSEIQQVFYLLYSHTDWI